MPKEDPYSFYYPSTNADNVMSVAAIFEGEFSIDWLEELTALKATLILSAVEKGVEEGTLRKKGPGIYSFADEERRTARLTGLPRDERERYYRIMASILIRELPDDDAKSLKIATYLRHVSNDAEGCGWLVRAGKTYAGSSTEMAIDCFEKVINDLMGKQGEAEDRLFVIAVLEYSNTVTLTRNTLKTLSLLHEAKMRAGRIGEESLRLLMEMHIAKQEWMSSHGEKALKRFERALATVEHPGDPGLIAATMDLKNYFLFWQGRFRDVIKTYERSLPDVERYPSGAFPVMTAITVARSYAMTGQLTQGLGMLHTIYDRCIEKGDLYLASHAGSAIAILMLVINRIDDAFRYFKSSLRQARQSQNHYVKLVVTFMFALAHHRKGENNESIRYLRRFLKGVRESHVSAQLYPYLMEICWAMETGAFPRVPGLSLEHEIQEMLRIRNVLIRGIAYRYQALLGKRRGWSNQRVVRSLSLSARLLEDSGHQIERAKTQLELARYHLSMGDAKRVRRLMRTASEILSPANAELIPDDLRAFVLVPNRQGAVLNEILNLKTEMAAAAQEKSQLLQQIVVTINRLIGAERGAVLLVDTETASRNLALRSSKNLTIEQVYHPNFASSRKIIEEVVLSGEGRVFEVGTSEETGLPPKESIRSGICVPFRLEGKPVGVLYHDNRLLGNVFSESDLRLLGYFAALVALDLGWAKSRQEVQQLAEKNGSPSITIEKDDEQTIRSDGIIGVSPAMQRVHAEIARVAGTDTTVLILGETGVGKNLIASAVHQQSLRNGGPFVTVQCSALTESLITSELFGHEKGAFTGATNRRIGRFEMADKGTLFLDEIGDLSLDVQARLLRVLQSKEFERVGGGKETLTSDFRLIAATNRSLEEDVTAQKFRRDLYYRISVFPLYIPPLRERREDIPLLARHFLRVYGLKNGHPRGDIPREIMDKLVSYDWPGNIREMENTIQRGIILGHGQRFLLPDLGIVKVKSTEGVSNPPGTLEENERRHILEALNRTGWRIYGPEGAARILAVKPTTLCSRMKKLGIQRPSANTRRKS
jgi:transcriptional regulator with GAF, ATPase, and Fis domain/tetratricopeptide (TPR) repeat protein